MKATPPPGFMFSDDSRKVLLIQQLESLLLDERLSIQRVKPRLTQSQPKGFFGNDPMHSLVLQVVTGKDK